MVYQYQPVDPMQSFAQGFQFTNAIRERGVAQQQAQAEQQKQAMRGQAMQAAIQNIRTNPSPDAIAEFYLQFPEMQKQFDAYRGALAEGDKGTMTAAAREALVAQRAGQSPASVFQQYAEAARNSNRPDLAKQFDDAARVAETSPESAELTTRMFYQGVDPDGYKALFGSEAATTFQKDFEFIKSQFGETAAAEFAQFGRSGAPVSIPLGDGRTYVGPAANAPGMGRWQATGQTAAPAQQEAPESVLERASTAKQISPEEAEMVRKSLGPNGQQAFAKWLRENKIAIARNVGGKTYYQIDGKWYDNPEGR